MAPIDVRHSCEQIAPGCTCRMISLAARVVAPREEMMEVANTYVPITITLLIDSASPDCTEKHQQSDILIM